MRSMASGYHNAVMPYVVILEIFRMQRLINNTEMLETVSLFFEGGEYEIT